MSDRSNWDYNMTAIGPRFINGTLNIFDGTMAGIAKGSVAAVGVS